jgi:cell division protein FtsZ
MAPIIEKEQIVQEEITRAEQEKRDKEDQVVGQLIGVYYKQEHKVYIFKGDDMYNDELIEALDNSPTYKRTNTELEKIMGLAGSQPKADIVEQPQEAVVEESETTDNYDNTEIY